jgi:hypothetical protein
LIIKEIVRNFNIFAHPEGKSKALTMGYDDDDTRYFIAYNPSSDK